MYQIMPSNQFNQKLSVAGNSQIETNKLFQELLFDAFHQAQHPDVGGHGSCTRLTAILQMAEHCRGGTAKKIQAFIQNFADVRYTKNDNGTHSFEFRDKPSVTIPTVTWYDWKHVTDKASVTVDPIKEIKRILNKAAKDGATCTNPAMLSDLQDFAIKHGIQWTAVAGKPAAGKSKKFGESKRPTSKV